MRVLFYNYRNGDFHIVRTFIRDILSKFKADTYGYYSCLPIIGQPDIPHIIRDIPNLEKIAPYKGVGSVPSPCYITKDEVLINTNYNAIGGVTCHNCVFRFLYDNFGVVYQQLGIKLEEELFYLPSIDFSYYQVEDIRKFFDSRPRRRVFWANNFANSGQSGNFDFNPIIDACSSRHPEVDFIITNKVPVQRENIFYLEDIVKKDKDNLNEAAFLSTYCDVLIGRLSGPHSFSLIKENLMNPSKIYVCFNSSKAVAIWVPERKSKVMWSDQYENFTMINIICRAIRGEING